MCIYVCNVGLLEQCHKLTYLGLYYAKFLTYFRFVQDMYIVGLKQLTNLIGLIILPILK